MQIRSVQVRRVRNLTDVTLELDPRLNVVCGPNASGKTALLEGIYMLARARSFRTHRIEEVVQHGSSTLEVAAQLLVRGGSVATGIEKGPGQLQLRYRGEAVRTVSSHARNVPVVLLTPDVHRLIGGAPKARRHWLDWAMFHVEPAYLSAWKAYHRALRHRNAALKQGATDSQLEGWEQGMAREGERLSGWRTRYVSDLEQALVPLAEDLAGGAPVVRLRRGWTDKDCLAGLLAKTRVSDRESGHTMFGPHRADVDFLLGEKPVARAFSRGQGKFFASLLVVAQAHVMTVRTGEPPLVLYDDFTAELDPGARMNVLRQLVESGNQVLVTTTEPLKVAGGTHFSGFHVERGKYKKMIE